MGKKAKIILFFLLIFIDQWSKFIFFHQEKILNEGISFGLLEQVGNTPMMFLLIILWLIIFIFLYWHKKFSWGILLFLSGSLSNIVDRVFYSGVRDFLPIPYFDLKNNLADYFIIVGVLIFFYEQISNQDHLSKSRSSSH